MLQDGAPTASRGVTFWVAVAIAFILVAGGITYLKVKAHGYFILSPGQAPVVTSEAACRPVGGGSFSLPGGRPCVQLVVPAGRAHTTDGTIMMVDVFEDRANPWQYLIKKVPLLNRLEKDSVLVNAKEIVSGSASQLDCQNSEEAYQAATAAPVAALRRLGYPVKEVDLGTQIATVYPGTPAARFGLQCGDVITGVDGKAVHTRDDLFAALRGLPAGTVVRVRLQRGVDGPAAVRNIVTSVRLAPRPSPVAKQPPDPKQGYIGIDTGTYLKYDFPFPVSAQVGSIGGPSDGLALALGFINTLSGGKLTGGLRVAATGTIDPDGTVGAIGGAAQKAVAVRRAGAQVFLVPAGDNYRDAKPEAGSMKVFPVATLDQALADLRSLGGQIPPPVATVK
ncbi:MAG TPA: PDZ domain-containing protein [Acidimicrobiales bacterium]|nr:PDZ domain-containing protein [Acidimicrobiales bacterium]